MKENESTATELMIADEAHGIMKKEFIERAVTLGAPPFRIFKKHLLPHLLPRLFVIAHLGIFQIYFGGTSVCYDIYCDPPMPIANEWSGLLGMYIKQINYQWWLAAGPLACFTITILAINSMAAGIDKGLTPPKPYKKRFWSRRKIESNQVTSLSVDEGLYGRRPLSREEVNKGKRTVESFLLLIFNECYQVFIAFIMRKLGLFISFS
ncbi:ABC transporter permease subunit [Bacillus sp. P14.5]|uniref:ABC transporter permease subunit n=1 Tax=Bacillus sp. P14.5 TaxID=1983400 RepID=UPI000DEBC5FB|nr:ABC transporter permease subunit [Bacillus sp. P14.5]